MKPNVNALDRIVRLIVGAVGILLIATGTVSGIWMYVVGAASLIMLVTALVKFCPLYKLLGVSTRRI